MNPGPNTSRQGVELHALAGGSPVAEGPPRSLLAGWVDLELIRPVLGEVRSSPTITEIRSAGICIQVSKQRTDIHADDARIVLIVGRPTVAGRTTTAGDLAVGAELDKLGGRFAVVFVDLARKKVELRTDRFGIRPLCWSFDGTRLAFSDRADCVPAKSPPSLDYQALFDYVYFHTIPSPRTVFRGVARLEPATALTIDGGRLSARRWWEPAFAPDGSGKKFTMEAEFREIVRNAVSAEASVANVGCFLSGGTDSSTVAGMLKATLGTATTFSIGFDEEGYDEMAYARVAARHFGTRHHEHYVTPSELVAGIPDVAAHYDQPFGNSSAVPAFICATVAHDNGVDKLLAGDGGDELFGGNSRYARQKIFEAWWALPEPLRHAASAAIDHRWAEKTPVVRKAASYVAQARVPMPGRMETYNLLNRFGHEKVFRPEFLRQVNADAPAELQRAVYSRYATAPFVDRMMAYDWRFTLTDNDLPKVCGTTRLASIDVGFPLLADELVDFALRLGSAEKVRGLRLRHFFKRSLIGFLPPEIIAKKKHGFGLPVGEWLLKHAAFRSLARASLSDLADRGLILPAFADSLFSRHLEEHPGYYGEMIWVLMMLGQWLSARHPNWRVD